MPIFVDEPIVTSPVAEPPGVTAPDPVGRPR
jgi:hypothetical protein